MGKKNKQKKWMKLRHRVVRNLAYVVLYPYSRIKYGLSVDKFKEQEKRPYLILFNHQTAFDQFFVGMAFKGPVYYLASEDLFSNGWVSSLIRFIVAPIPIKKQAMDVSAIINCIRVAKEGGTIAIAPEGNRTYSGKTEYMSPAITTLARKLNLPIVLYHIEGGYGVQPRWSDTLRKGKMHCYVHSVIKPEQYKDMTNDELFSLIEKGLEVNEANADNKFLSDKRAQYLERAMYVCPYCGLSQFYSEKNEIECKKCGRKIHYGTDTKLNGVGFEFPFKFVSDWYDYQKDYVNKLDLNEYTSTPLYRDKALLSQVIIYKKKIPLLKQAVVSLYGDRIVVNEGKGDTIVFDFSKVSAVSVLGRNKLNIYFDKKIYQIKSDKHFNALKYVNIYYRHKNISRGDTDAKFLGL